MLALAKINNKNSSSQTMCLLHSQKHKKSSTEYTSSPSYLPPLYTILPSIPPSSLYHPPLHTSLFSLLLFIYLWNTHPPLYTSLLSPLIHLPLEYRPPPSLFLTSYLPLKHTASFLPCAFGTTLHLSPFS